MAEKRTSQATGSRWVFGQAPGQRKTAFRAGLYARVSTHDRRLSPCKIALCGSTRHGEDGRS